MKTSYSLEILKVFWVVGALERLAGLGILQDPPISVNPDEIDFFLDVDEHRNDIFTDDDEVRELTLVLINSQCPNTPKEDIKPIVDLVLDYKNNRIELVKTELVKWVHEN